MLTARTSESDRVVGLDPGADDYVTKPFSTARAAGARPRRAAPAPPRRAARAGRLSWPAPRRRFRCGRYRRGRGRIRLTRREFELLRYLVENRNRVLSRDRLLERVWGYDRIIETRSVDVHVGRLRSKLAPPGNRSRPSWAWATGSWSDVNFQGRLDRPLSGMILRPDHCILANLLPEVDESDLDHERAAGALDAVPVLVLRLPDDLLSCSSRTSQPGGRADGIPADCSAFRTLFSE